MSAKRCTWRSRTGRAQCTNDAVEDGLCALHLASAKATESRRKKFEAKQESRRDHDAEARGEAQKRVNRLKRQGVRAEVRIARHGATVRYEVVLTEPDAVVDLVKGLKKKVAK